MILGILVGDQNFKKSYHIEGWTKWHRKGFAKHTKFDASDRRRLTNDLTRWGLVTPYGVVDLGQHWFR